MVVRLRRALFGLLGLLLILALPSSAVSVESRQVTTLLEQARAEEKTGNYSAAEALYKRTLQLAPGNIEILKRLGIVQQTELNFDDSIQNFQQVLAHDPHYPEVNFFLALSYYGKNDLAAATQSFTRELASPHPHPRCRYYFALALQAEGRVDEAIAQLNRAVAENPKDADSLYQLARIYKNASIQAMDRLKELDPDSFQVHALMGEIYGDEQRYPEAIQQYQAALAKRPDAPGLHYTMGVAYWAQNQFDPAAAQFSEALKENPQDPLTNLYLGDIAVRQRRFAEALKYLRVAEKGQPAMAQVHLLLGKCYQGQEDYADAKAEYLAAIAGDPGAAQPHYLLAQVYRKLNQPQASASELARFAELSKAGKTP